MLCSSLTGSILAGCLFLAPLSAQGLDSRQVESLREVIGAEIEEQEIVGLSAAVGMGGELVWTEGFGMADLENDVPATEHTVYRLASISKPVTATALMQLVEAGRLGLDDTISEHIPEWPEKRWPVTVRQVLCHQGGIRHYLDKDVRRNTKAYRSATDALEYFAEDPLIGEPGTRYKYSSYGYNLLGAVIEGVSGKSFVEYLESEVFPRAGTVAMQDDAQARIIKHRAKGYRRTRDGELRNSMMVDVSYKVGGGGLCSTAGDLVRFAHAVHKGELVRPETRDMMWTAQKTRDGETTRYGLGWQVGELGGQRLVAHSGSQSRVKTMLMLLPDRDLVVSVMCNTESANPRRIATRMLRSLSEER